MGKLTPEQLSLKNQINALRGWSKCPDRSERTRPGREAQLLRFLAQVDPDNKMSDRDRLRAAQNLKTAFYKDMARRRWQKAREQKAGA